jgi:hypothetical protein
MACLFIRLIMVFLVASKKCRAEETKDKYEDLIYTSMKSIVSLDELVTQLSVQVSKLTTSLSAIKVEGGKIQKDLENTKARIAEVEDYRVRALEKKVEKLTTSLELVKEKAGESQNDLDDTKSKMANLEKKVVAGLQKRVDLLTTSVKETNAKVDTIDGEVTLVSGEDKAGASKCVKVCAGTTGRTKTSWANYSGNHGIYTDVDISSCGFIKTPTVTTSVEGSSSHWVVSGTASVYNTSPTKFRIYLYKKNLRAKQAKSWKYNVEWIAVGHTC